MNARGEVEVAIAKGVLWIFERYAEGWSLRRIADELNRAGILTGRR